jgi:hypothetical protein
MYRGISEFERGLLKALKRFEIVKSTVHVSIALKSKIRTSSLSQRMTMHSPEWLEVGHSKVDFLHFDVT